MHWFHANFFFHFACILLGSARAVHPRHCSACVPAPKPEDDGTGPQESSASGQCVVGFALRAQFEHLDLNAGSPFLVSQRYEDVALCSAAPEGLWGHSLYALIDQLRATVPWRNHQREPRHTLPQMRSVVKSSELDVQFQKCAQVVTESEFPQVRVYLEVKNLESGTDLLQVSIRDTISDIISLQSNGKVPDKEYQTFNTDTLPGTYTHIKPSALTHYLVVTESEFPQVRVYLEVKNLESGTDLLQVSIRDTISDIISLQSNGKVPDKEYQTFNTDTLPAGSSYNVSYTASVKGSAHVDLFLPAFLTFSSISQNDIHSFRPVMTNFTLRINTTEKVCVNHALHFAGFCLAFLISTLLLAFTLLTAGCFFKKCLMCTPQHRRRSFNIEAEPVEADCNTANSANENAAFEDRIIDIMTLEDPHDMSPALDKLELSSLLRAAVMVECVRVQMLKGVFRVLTAGLSESGNDVSVLDLLSHMTDMQDDQNSQHLATDVHSERQNAEQLRLETFHRREELHTIISEEIEEAAMTRGTHLANQLLHRFYTCQDQLESVLDLFIANQRAALSEQQAQRHFLLQGLRDLQHSMREMFGVFSRHIDGWFTRIRREGVLSDEHCMQQLARAESALQRVQKCFEERLGREHSAARGDIVKTRRARISETLCEQKLEQQDLVCGSVCDEPLEDYLMRWQTLLCAHNTHFSELITHLDQEAAAHIRRVLVCVLRDAVADLKQVECETSESLQEAGVPRWLLLQLRAGSVVGGILADTEAELGIQKREAAKTLRMTRSGIQTIREQELQRQSNRRERMHTYCRSLWESQCSLSESDLLRMQLEYVKSVCRMDCCLVLSHVRSREKRCNTPTNQSTEHTVDHFSSDPCSIFTHAQVCVCEDEQSMCEERVTMQLAAVQWDKLERKYRVVETHTALLTLQTLLMQAVPHAPAGEELSQAIHTHSLALEEAELLLQKEEADWERSMDGLGKLLTPDEELFQVNAEGTITECLQEALYKRQQLTHTLTESLRIEMRRQQVMEDLREQQELKRLYTHFDQDLFLVALLVKLSSVSEPVLQQLLYLLLPTQPEGELQSLIHTLAPKEGLILEPCFHLVDRLRNDVISIHKAPGSHTHTGRMLKKKQKLVEKLFSRSHADRLGHDPVPVNTQPTAEAATQKEEACAVVEQSTPETVERNSRAGEVETAAEGDMAEEKLFTIHNTHPPHTEEASHVSHSRKKRRKLKFKKGAVAPLEQM